ncbi:MAG: phosphate ABC transporter ATP-binding protein [Hyphomicrobiales bacterium]|nr:phosphate ABC transporter ATP-binding protein [Hyphomicrobiales bacterium]
MNLSPLMDLHVHLGAVPRHNRAHNVKLSIRKFSFWYGVNQALFDIDLDICTREVTAFIGPSGCGKSTLLNSLNRVNETLPDIRHEGDILLDGASVHDPAIDPTQLRKRFGWVAQKADPFAWSVYVNVAYGPKLHGLVSSRKETDAHVLKFLERANLWEELKDCLDQNAFQLSGGQQQRLCIARAISIEPEILLMDEPASALDPLATAKLEELVNDLRRDFTIVFVTHNMQQAARIAQRVAFFHLGRLIEVGDAEKIFINPREPLTQRYVTGRFG